MKEKINYAELEEKIDADILLLTFSDWADDICKHNEFYECSHFKNSEKYCMDCNCPIIEQFYNSNYYKDLFKGLQEVNSEK